MSWRAKLVIVLLLATLYCLLLFSQGCAARSYSSTDQKVGEEQWDYKPCPIELRAGQHDWCWCVEREDGEHCQPE